MNDGAIERRVRWACILALIALGLIALAVLVPTPLPVIVAMSAGQVIGTASLALYLAAILADVRRTRLLAPAKVDATDESREGKGGNPGEKKADS